MRLLLLCPLLAACTVRTGLCERDQDCPPGQVCNLATHRCQRPEGSDHDMAAPETDLLPPAETDLLPPAEPDLFMPPPPDLAGVDLLGIATLEVRRTGDGAGRVRSTPPGIDCGAHCVSVVPEGTRLELQAEAETDSFFSGWSGACTGEARCMLTVRGMVRVDASFRRRSFALVASGTSHTLRTVFGLSPPALGGLWAAGDQDTVLRWDGTRWTSIPTTTSASIRGLWASAVNNLWVVGEMAPRRWNGTTWASASGSFLQPLWAIWGASAADIWAVGDQGYAVHFNGTSWSDEPTGILQRLHAIWGQTPTDIWAVGDKGSVVRWNGSEWKTVASGTMADLLAIWGAGSTAVWAAGQGGTLLRWDGTRWLAETSPLPGRTLRGLFGFSDGSGQAVEVWAVGDGGAALRWHAGRWSAVAHAHPLTLHAVWGERPGELWAVGERGTILRYGAHR